MKFKKGDKIIVTAGKDKGRAANIEKVFPKEGRVLVPGVNMFKKHVRALSQGQKSGIFEIPRPLPVGNIALVCPSCKKPTRVGYKISKDGKMRICRICKGVI